MRTGWSDGGPHPASSSPTATPATPATTTARTNQGPTLARVGGGKTSRRGDAVTPGTVGRTSPAGAGRDMPARGAGGCRAAPGCPCPTITVVSSPRLSTAAGRSLGPRDLGARPRASADELTSVASCIPTVPTVAPLAGASAPRAGGASSPDHSAPRSRRVAAGCGEATAPAPSLSVAFTPSCSASPFSDSNITCPMEMTPRRAVAPNDGHAW